MNITPEFRQAMAAYQTAVATHGEDSPQARQAFTLAMYHAPDEFMEEANSLAKEMGLLPQPSGYLEDGTPVFRLDEMVQAAGLSPEEGAQAFTELQAHYAALGLPSGVVDPARVHRKQ